MIRIFSVPRIVSAFFKNLIWEIPAKNKEIYLTFDDGPSPEITEWIIEELNKYNALATFFCVGENAAKYPVLADLIRQKGHSIGNHTFNHLNGKITSTNNYLANVRKCEEVVESKLFRPPYGKLSFHQTRGLLKNDFRIIMWTILSYDFDNKIDPEKIFKRITKQTCPGSIVVFHDNVKVLQNLKYVLPAYLDYCTKKGYSFLAL